MMSQVFRCQVVSADARCVVAAQVCQALDAAPSLQPLPARGPAASLEGEAVIFVTRIQQVEQTLAQLDRWRAQRPGVPRLLAGVDLQAPQLDRLLRGGVQDFVATPWTDDELVTRLYRALGLYAAAASNGRPAPSPAVPRDPRLAHFIGANAALTTQLERLPVYAACDASVLILGETGTGKEVCARAVHDLSARAGKPWVALNCGAMPTELIESELFGHARGAFTHAHASHAGLVRAAEGGSLFLDDIDCLPLPAQVKLLRFLQEREYRPVGATALQHADVRVIAASNQRLPGMVARGEFRADLFFRLKVLVLQLPPLRERREDIVPLARHFIARFAQRHGRSIQGLAPPALERLFAHEWPGNVRELQHVIERAVLLSCGPLLEAADLDLAGPGEGVGIELTPETFRAAKGRVVQQFERSYIEQLLARCGGNITRAAQEAGKNRRAFFELMRKHGITAAGFRRVSG